ncbi:MAG: GIY-YIG nuclease family protein [bacterium]
MAITYLLQIYLGKPKTIKIGKLGRFYFKRGNYVYAGSAKTNMAKRVARHLRKKKKKFWHIDYLLQYAEVKKVLMSNLSEEKLASLLSKKLAIPVKGFGSSDKKNKSHLFCGLLTAIKIPL